MGQVEVSIIIPVYNVESYVRESLLSALNQTFKDIEYIIIDDCSTDCSMDIVHDVLDGHPRKSDVHIYCHEKNEGLSVARNTGMLKATGKYIFFMDSDDEITPDCIEKHYNAITQSASDFTIADVELIGAKSVHVKQISNDCLSVDLFSSFLRRKWIVSAWNKLYSKKFIESNSLSFQSGILFEDILWSYNLCLHTNRVAWLKEKTYRYKVRKNSITVSRNSSRKIESFLFILDKMMSDWENGLINRKYKKDLTFMMVFYRLNASLLLLNYEGSRKDATSYYNRLNSGRLAGLSSWSCSSMILKLSFSLFYIIMFPIYSFYKTLSR